MIDELSRVKLLEKLGFEDKKKEKQIFDLGTQKNKKTMS